MSEEITVEGGCHCGAVRFEVVTSPEVVVTECNCSICAMCGFQHLIVEPAALTVREGASDLTTYTFNTGTAKHTFCRHCGIKPFYVPRSHPDGYSVNFRCVDQSRFRHVELVPFDGRNWEQSVESFRGRELSQRGNSATLAPSFPAERGMWYLIDDFLEQSWVMKLFILLGWLCVAIMLSAMVDTGVIQLQKQFAEEPQQTMVE
jgi:hypothetical protein